MSARPGYALPLTLAAIIVIAMVATIAAQQVRNSTQTITALSDQMRIRSEMISAEQTLIYELLTEPMTLNGVSVGQVSDPAALLFGTGAQSSTQTLILVNGQAYHYGQDYPVIARLYADQTFLNANSRDPVYISDMLDLFGVPRTEHSRFVATLIDYQDQDNLRSLGGAEARDYEAPGLPSNKPLRDALELCAIKHWSDSAVCEDRGRLLMTLRTRSADRMNANLASEALLTFLMPDTQAEEIARVHSSFARSELRSFSEIGAPAFDEIRDPLSIATTAGPRLTLITHSLDGVISQRTVVELTPTSLISPFVVHSKYAIGGDYTQNILRIERIDDVPPLPQPTSITPEF